MVQLPAYIGATEGMDSEEFSQWLALNREGVEAVESALGLNIASREDLLSAETLSVADMASFTPLGMDNTTVKKLITALINLADYVWGGNDIRLHRHPVFQQQYGHRDPGHDG